MGITDISPNESHRYWALMIIILAIAGIGLGWLKEGYQGRIIDLVIREFFH